MKKIFITLFFVVLTFCVSVTICAHPGRTDKNGGHTDKSTGTYHYHHGYEAHLHTGGVCPYEFDDKTGERSGASNRSNNVSSQRSIITGSASSDKKQQASSDTIKDVGIVAAIFLVLCSPCIISFIASHKNK